MDGPDTTDTLRTRRLERVAVIAIGIYVGAFVISSPTMGEPR
jgi:hypothetical protein